MVKSLPPSINRRGASSAARRARRVGQMLVGLVTAASILVSPLQATAATYYWDTNGDTAGFGTASGTWGSSDFWSTDSTGGTVPSPVTTTTADGLYFGTNSVGLATGTVTVSGVQSANSLFFGSASGAITLSGGTIDFGGSSPTITVSNGSDKIASGISGAAYTKAGNGELVLTGTNSGGGISLNAGTLSLGNNRALGSGTLTINGGVLFDNGTTFTNAYNTPIVINENFTKGNTVGRAMDMGSGAIKLAKAVTITDQEHPITFGGVVTDLAGGNTLNAFDITYGGNGNPFSGCRFSMGGAVTLRGNQTLTALGSNVQMNGAISDGGNGYSLTVDASTSGGGQAYLNAANTFSGPTRVKGNGWTSSNTNYSVLYVNHANALQNSTLDMNAADSGFVIFEQNSTLGGLSGSRNLGGIGGSTGINKVGMNGYTLSVGNNNSSTTYSGTLSNGALTKIGTGTLTLTAANTYSGGTIINGGRLTAGNANALGTSGAITINNGGTLGVADGVTFTRPLTINSGGKVWTGNNSTVALPSAASLSAWLSNNTAGGDLTSAAILSGSGAMTPSALTSAWTSNTGSSSGYLSDILSLAGTGTGNVFVLSMSYSAVIGDMNIWYRETSGDAFAPVGTSFVGLGAWNSSYSTVGQYGRDPLAGTVWVVTDHNSEFVIVPEPGTLALTGIAAAFAGWAGRRRRRAATAARCPS